MRSSGKSPAETPPERIFAAYDEDELVFAFDRGGGPILPPEGDEPPLEVHPHVHGRIALAEATTRIRGALAGATTVADVRSRLEAAGFEVLETPRRALEWLGPIA